MNYNLHNQCSTLLIGNIKDDDIVREVKEPSNIETHEKVVLLRHYCNQFHFCNLSCFKNYYI